MLQVGTKQKSTDLTISKEVPGDLSAHSSTGMVQEADCRDGEETGRAKRRAETPVKNWGQQAKRQCWLFSTLKFTWLENPILHLTLIPVLLTSPYTRATKDKLQQISPTPLSQQRPCVPGFGSPRNLQNYSTANAIKSEHLSYIFLL